MGMTISIHEYRIVKSLHEKVMNLYLYILPHFDHPLGVLTVIVAGRDGPVLDRTLVVIRPSFIGVQLKNLIE